MALQKGSKLMYEWLRERRSGEVHSKYVILEATKWNPVSFRTYIGKHKLAPFLLPLIGEKYKVLLDGSEISEEYFHETFTQTAPKKVVLTSGDKLYGSTCEYKLIEPIGNGAIGHVWSASVSISGEEEMVAVKIMFPREDLLSASKLGNIRERFRREGELGMKLDHPNIVKYIDLGEAQRNPFIVMELSESSIGKELNKSNRVSNDEAYDIIKNCLEGLAYLHGRGCAHRDVKPDNILVFSDTYKLGDLGIVKWSDFDEILTKGGTITKESMQLGSWFYMAPEQQTDPHDAVPESDVYALGITWIEILTGKLPSPHAIGARAFDLPDEISPNLYKLLDSMLEYDFKNRPSVGEINRAMRGLRN